MRKLNGITINGEFLGNGVVINGMFRAICAISPVIMREFVLIINKIDALEEAVKISNFNCDNDKNCMDIEFENKKSKGVASLYFKIYNGEPELTDCKITFGENTYSTIKDNIPIPTTKDKVINNDSLYEKQKKLQALKEAKLAKLKQERAPSSGASKSADKTIPKNTTDKKPSTKEGKIQELLEKKRKMLEAKKEGAPAETKEGVNDTAIENISGAQAENNTLQKDTETISSAGTAKTAKTETDANSNSASNGSINSFADNSADNPANEISEMSAYENDNMQDEAIDEQPKLSLDDFTEEELENLSLEELEQLERELANDNEQEYYDDSEYSHGNDSFSSASAIELAEKLSQGLADGITQGLTQGLAQGLSQGLSQGFQNFNPGFGQNVPPAQNYNQPFNDNFNNSWGGNSGNQNFSDFNKKTVDYSDSDNFNNQHVTAPNDYMQKLTDIDDKNLKDSMMAQDSYLYDEDSNPDELADFYSDFYDSPPSVSISNNEQTNIPVTIAGVSEYRDETQDELEMLKAQLAAMQEQNTSGNKKMTLDEYMARQKEIEEAKEKLRRKKIRIVGSGGRVNAKALDGNVYVSGSKVYKWGDVRHLDE